MDELRNGTARVLARAPVGLSLKPRNRRRFWTVALGLALVAGSNLPAATAKSATKKKIPSTTTTVSRPANPFSDRSVRAAYDHFIDVVYALTQDARPYRTELAKVATGDALSYWMGVYATYKAGDHWSGKRQDMKAFDFRVVELSSTQAIVRVCQFESAAPLLDKAGSPVAGTAKSESSDKRLVFQYAGKRGWLLSESYRLEDVEGESTCTDGKV